MNLLGVIFFLVIVGAPLLAGLLGSGCVSPKASGVDNLKIEIHYAPDATKCYVIFDWKGSPVGGNCK